VICADAATVLGKSEAEHDLAAVGTTLRSHGGLHEQRVPFVISHPLREGATQHPDLRNADLHDLLLNGLA
jgi:phosphonoacetate hydrolase